MPQFGCRIYATSLAIATIAGSGSAFALEYDAQAYIEQVGPKQAAFRDCLRDQSVRLGENNTESADTILRAVAALCRSAEDELRVLYARTPFPRSYVDNIVAGLRKSGEDAGIAELLKKRSEVRTSR